MATEDDELDETIRENIAAPLRARGEEGEMEQHKLSDQVAAAKYLRNGRAASKPHRGLRFSKIVPDGTT